MHLKVCARVCVSLVDAGVVGGGDDAAQKICSDVQKPMRRCQIGQQSRRWMKRIHCGGEVTSRRCKDIDGKQPLQKCL